MKNILILLLLLLLPNYLFAADVYLDENTTGGCSNGSTDYLVSGRSCGGAGTETVYVDLRTFSNNLGSGDHGYIRAGEYDYNTNLGSWSTGILVIDGTGTIVENYNSEVVWLQTGLDHTGTMQANEYNNPVLIDGTNCTLQGNGYNLFIWGCVIMSGTNPKITGVDLSGGSDKQDVYPSGRWGDLIRITSASGALIQDCKFHDNQAGTTATENKAAILHGTASGSSNDVNTIIENSHFYDLVADVAYVKYQDQDSSGTTQATYRYNFFDGVGGIEGPNSAGSQYIVVHHNVFVNSTSIQHGGTNQTLGMKSHHNTFYGSSTSTRVSWAWPPSTLTEFDVYGNIFYYAGSSTVYAQQFDEATSVGSGNFDDNAYYQAGSGAVRFYRNYSALTFAQWQSFTSDEASSDTSDPGFDPDDASLDGSDPEDFKRTSYADGRGAYTSDLDVIGLSSGDTNAPTVQSAAINGTAATIVFSEDLDDTAFANLINGDLVFTGTTTGASDLESCSENNGTVTCTADATFVTNETVTLSSSGLTGDELCDGSSNCIASLSGEGVSNNTPAAQGSITNSGVYNADGNAVTYNADGTSIGLD